LEHFEMLRTPLLSESERQQVETFYHTCVNQLQTWSQNWKSDRQQFSHFVRDWCLSNSSWRLLLVVDQFEELVTQCDKDVREAFLDLLGDVLKDCPEQLKVVATLRADFEPRFIDSEQLKPYWDKARFLMRAMRSDELRRAIEGPALEHILYFETERDRNLVDQLIDEVGQMPGALPLLSFALSEIYREYVRQDDVQDRTLKWQHYRKVGGVAGSLTRRATEEYNKLDTSHQATMKRLILRMVTIEGGGLARRQVFDSELIYASEEENKLRQQVIEHLVRERLLVQGRLLLQGQNQGKSTEEPYVEPIHDLLVRGWEMLQEWIKQEQENIALRQRLTPAAKDWIQRDWKHRRAALWLEDGDRLTKLNEVINSDSNWLNRLESIFVKRSSKVRQARIKKLEEDLRISEERRHIAQLREQAARALNLLPTFKASQGLVLAIDTLSQSVKVAPEVLPSALYSLTQAVRMSPEQNLFKIRLRDGNLASFESVSFSPDSKTIASIDQDGTIRLWNLQDQLLKEFKAHDHTGSRGQQSVSFSPNGESLVSVGVTKDSTVMRLWSLQGDLREHLSLALSNYTHKNQAYH
jgi:hypothetical protein